MSGSRTPPGIRSGGGSASQRDPYILEIRNPDGVVVERYFTGAATSPVHEELSAGIAVLYTLARRRAMRLDLLLRTLSTDLDRLR